MTFVDQSRSRIRGKIKVEIFLVRRRLGHKLTTLKKSTKLSTAPNSSLAGVQSGHHDLNSTRMPRR